MAEEPDKGRSWLVAVAALVINMVTAGIFRAQGLLFVEFINAYAVNRKGAALPFSVRTAIRNLLAPVAGILGQKYGAKNVVLIGGVLSALSSAACFFAPDLIWITFTWGLINGIGMTLVTVLPQVVISQYFIKYRTTATGISFSGGCLGSLVFPAILEMILHTYGLQGTFFILAAMFMHIVPAAMILRTPPWLKNNKFQNTSSNNEAGVEGKLPNNQTYNKDSNVRKCDCGVQVGNDTRIHDIFREKAVVRDAECKHPSLPRPRSYSYSGLTHQMHMNHIQRTSMFRTNSSIGLNYKTLSSKPENAFDLNLEYLKRNSDLVFHMLSMEIPNVEISYRAILLEVEQDDLWHPDKNEIMQEIENIYFHIEKSLEIDQISSNTSKPSGLYLKRTLLSGTLTISKKSESLRAVKRYLKTYKERGLQQLGKIRSAPNMSNIYKEIARKDYVMSKMKQLCNSNEIRVISHLCQYNPKDVLKVLFQIRNLYKMYSDLESCDLCDSSELCSTVETGDISSYRKESCPKEQPCCEKESKEDANSFKVHIKAALNLHTKAIFLLICCTRAAFFLSFNPVVTTVVDFAMDRGLREDDGKYIIVALSFGDLLGRTCLGWITDRGYASLPRYMLFGMSFLSACTISIPLMYSRWTILSSIAVFGMIQGSLFVRHPVLVAKYLMPNEQSIAVGCMDFFSGIISLLLPLYIGFFRDTIGSYNQIYYINGIIVFLSGIGWIFESRMVRTKNSPDKNLPAS